MRHTRYGSLWVRTVAKAVLLHLAGRKTVDRGVMSKNFLENMFPPECRSKNGALSSALIAEHRKNSYALADKIARSSEIKFQHRKTIFLVDVQVILSSVDRLDGRQANPNRRWKVARLARRASAFAGNVSGRESRANKT